MTGFAGNDVFFAEKGLRACYPGKAGDDPVLITGPTDSYCN